MNYRLMKYKSYILVKDWKLVSKHLSVNLLRKRLDEGRNMAILRVHLLYYGKSLPHADFALMSHEAV